MSMFRLSPKRKMILSGTNYEPGMTIEVTVPMNTRSLPWSSQVREQILTQFKLRYGIDATRGVNMGPTFFTITQIS